MQELKEDLTRYNNVVISLIQRSTEIVPLKQRRGQPVKPLTIVAICSYKSSNVSMQSVYILLSNMILLDNINFK